MKSIKAMLAGGCSDGSVSNKLAMVAEKCLYMNMRSRPYYPRKCKRVGPATMTIDSLPAELLFEILVRLPADYIVERARFVCRRWSHIIHSDAFVKAQILHTGYQLLLALECHPILITASASPSGGGCIHTSELSYDCRSQMLSSSNGLAVEFIDWYNSSGVKIVNPATKQSLTLLSPVEHLAIHSKCGIAFAASSSNYKFTMPYYGSRRSGARALAILTFGVDNSWRDVAVDHLPLHARSLLIFRPPLITEGFMHWVRPGVPYCVTMDVESEMIRVVESPYSQGGLGWCPYYLSTGKFLSVLINCGNLRWEIFEMDMESGGWRKAGGDIELRGDALERRLGSTRGNILEPFGWVKYPEVLAFSYSANIRACIFYNLHTHEISSIELPFSCSSFHALVHKNSLTWLP